MDPVCPWCNEPVTESEYPTAVAVVHGDDGQLHPWHRECLLRQVTGSVGHLKHWCACYGGNPDAELDPEAMTKRQAALAAVALYEQQMRTRDI